MNRSIGVRTREVSRTSGSAGRTSGRKDQWSASTRSAVSESARAAAELAAESAVESALPRAGAEPVRGAGASPGAPALIQRWIKDFSEAGNGSSGGISSVEIRCHKRLPFKSCGATAGPERPPIRTPAAVLSDKPFSRSAGPWHFTQRFFSSGAISSANRGGAATEGVVPTAVGAVTGGGSAERIDVLGIPTAAANPAASNHAIRRLGKSALIRERA